MSIEEFTGNIYLEDAEEFLKRLPTNSVDLIPTDVPYGIGICETEWDTIPSLEVFKEMNRVLKPGKWLYCMSSPRQDVFVKMCHRIEKAGFDIGFTSLYWCYLNGHFYASKVRKFVTRRVIIPEHIYEGFLGFNPTPALEVIIVAMKPLSEKNYLSQALANRGGISRFERCRIPVRYEEVKQSPMGNSGIFDGGWKSLRKRKSGTQPHPMEWDKPHDDEWEGDPNGRYPANILCSDMALDIGSSTVSSGGDQRKRYNRDIYFLKGTKSKVPHGYGDKGDYSRYFDLDAWWERFCQFLFIKKPSVKEKDAGLDDLPDVLICTKTGESRPSRINNDGDFGGGHKRLGKNPHISVKPIKLMSYLIEMGSDPCDIVVDPFCGSGTTGISAILSGRKFIGNDIDPYMINEVVPRRLKYWKNEVVRKKEEKETGLGKWL